MDADMKRVVLSLPEELIQAADEVKQRDFYDKPYTELYRYLIRRGLDSLKAEPAQSGAGKP